MASIQRGFVFIYLQRGRTRAEFKPLADLRNNLVQAAILAGLRVTKPGPPVPPLRRKAKGWAGPIAQRRSCAPTPESVVQNEANRMPARHLY